MNTVASDLLKIVTRGLDHLTPTTGTAREFDEESREACKLGLDVLKLILQHLEKFGAGRGDKLPSENTTTTEKILLDIITCGFVQACDLDKINDPDWPKSRRNGYDAYAHIPEELQKAWQTLSQEARLAAYSVAKYACDNAPDPRE